MARFAGLFRFCYHFAYNEWTIKLLLASCGFEFLFLFSTLYESIYFKGVIIFLRLIQVLAT